MAYFAKINISGNGVVRVCSVDNQKLLDENGIESESKGIAHMERHGEEDSFYWKQTSYNTRGNEHALGGTPLRKNYAGRGYTYDKTRDAFIAPQPYTSWTLNETTCLWEPPIAYPADLKNYSWDEATTNWKEIT